MHLALNDINPETLEETSSLISNKNIRVTQHVFNVAEKNAMFQFAENINQTNNHVHIFISNAGICHFFSFSKMPIEYFEEIM